MGSFLKNLCFPNDNACFCGFRTSKIHLKSIKTHGRKQTSILGSFFFVDFGFTLAPKIDPESMLKFNRFLEAFSRPPPPPHGEREANWLWGP